MNRVPLLVFAAVFAVLGVIAASSVYVSGKNEATMKAPGIEPAPAAKSDRRGELRVWRGLA
jgi:hypothetical protein